MYSFESYTRKTAIHVLTVACFIVAFLLFGISQVVGIAFPMLYQITGLILLVMGVYFLTRYILKKYRYEITPSNIEDALGQPILDLVITETTGKRIAVVARVALRDITQVVVADKEQDNVSPKEKLEEIRRQNKAMAQKNIVFRYINTPFVSRVCYVVVPTENSVLVIPFDPNMVYALQQGMGGDATL